MYTFGVPVEPDVYIIVAISSAVGFTSYIFFFEPIISNCCKVRSFIPLELIFFICNSLGASKQIIVSIFKLFRL